MESQGSELGLEGSSSLPGLESAAGDLEEEREGDGEGERDGSPPTFPAEMGPAAAAAAAAAMGADGGDGGCPEVGGTRVCLHMEEREQGGSGHRSRPAGEVGWRSTTAAAVLGRRGAVRWGRFVDCGGGGGGGG